MIVSNWKDYEIIATGGGEKLERWGDIILLRPDPQIIWPSPFDLSKYKNLSAIYRRSDKGGGGWQNLKKVPDEWTIGYKDLKFSLKLMGFKHVGLFPEQALNWEFMTDLVKKEIEYRKEKYLEENSGYSCVGDLKTFLDNARKEDERRLAAKTKTDIVIENGVLHAIHDNHSIPDLDLAIPLPPVPPKPDIKVLNLFAYTGGASVALAAAGAKVTHVDAARGMVDRAKQNATLSGVDSIRYIVDDCAKFVAREIKRGALYDAVIMDPPSYGRGPSGEIWKIEDSLFDLVSLTARVLKPDPLFFLINSYTTGLQPTVIENILNLCLKDFSGKANGYEVCLPTSQGIVMPCGCSGLWQNQRTLTNGYGSGKWINRN